MRAEPDRLIRGECEFGHWKANIRKADGALRQYVLGFVGFEGSLQLVRERHLPSPEAALVINLGAPYRVIDPDGRSWSSCGGSIAAMGVRDRRFIVETPTGLKNLLLVRLTPIGAHLIFGVPMWEVRNRALDLHDLRPRLARDLSRRLEGQVEWRTRFMIVEELLASCIAESRAASAAISWAWQILRKADGSPAIGAIARELELSHKQLIAQFKRKIGLPPKKVARVLRFNRVLWSFKLANTIGWASVALDCGYADQAHLIREFRDFAGGTPSEIARLAAGFTYRD